MEKGFDVAQDMIFVNQVNRSAFMIVEASEGTLAGRKLFLYDHF